MTEVVLKLFKVTLDKDYYMDMTEKGLIVPQEFVKKSFEFLLDRESKDSILQQFDIAQITDFFPEYEDDYDKCTYYFCDEPFLI
jgi:hypothetical protein